MMGVFVPIRNVFHVLLRQSDPILWRKFRHYRYIHIKVYGSYVDIIPQTTIKPISAVNTITVALIPDAPDIEIILINEFKRVSGYQVFLGSALK